MRGFLGWDVGAWHCDRGASRDALVLLGEDASGALHPAGRPWRGNLRATLMSTEGAALLTGLLAHVESEPSGWRELVLAIDTPLGWPDAFRALLDGAAPGHVPDRKDANPLLLRATERWLAARGHRPLSAVQDLIGSQSTKGLCALARLGLEPAGTGVWRAQLGGTLATAIEAYPAPCARSPWMLEARAALALDDPRPDVQDALTCALVAWAFVAAPERLVPPPPEVSACEGWIHVPADCLGTGSGRAAVRYEERRAAADRSRSGGDRSGLGNGRKPRPGRRLKPPDI